MLLFPQASGKDLIENCYFLPAFESFLPFFFSFSLLNLS